MICCHGSTNYSFFLINYLVFDKYLGNVLFWIPKSTSYKSLSQDNYIWFLWSKSCVRWYIVLWCKCWSTGRFWAFRLIFQKKSTIIDHITKRKINENKEQSTVYYIWISVEESDMWWYRQKRVDKEETMLYNEEKLIKIEKKTQIIMTNKY